MWHFEGLWGYEGFASRWIIIGDVCKLKERGFAMDDSCFFARGCFACTIKYEGIVINLERSRTHLGISYPRFFP
jgi:hypothetical protein